MTISSCLISSDTSIYSKIFFIPARPVRIQGRGNAMLRTIALIALFILVPASGLQAGLVINEFVTGTSDDWVELSLVGAENEKMDISGLFVTMYYGTNEPLGTEPVTIYGWNRPETPYDDRFIVVHLTGAGIPDETDRTGDTNRNGHIDVYCDNYSGSLWNSDGVVALDSDDDPANGGIIDFVFYSNRDGSPSETILSYVAAAQASGHWPAMRRRIAPGMRRFHRREGTAVVLQAFPGKRRATATAQPTSSLPPSRPPANPTLK